MHEGHGRRQHSPIHDRAAPDVAGPAASLFAALKESQARLELAADAAQLGIWDWDVATGLMNYSPRAKAICGFPPDLQVTYEDAKRVTHPEDYPRTSSMARRALDPAIRESEPYEYRIVRPDGAVRWVQAFGEAVFEEVDGETRAVRYVGTLQDVTERIRLEQAQRADQARLALAVEAGRMAVWEIDFTTDEVTGSPELNRILGFPDDSKPTAGDIRRRYYAGERERIFALARAARHRGDRRLEADLRWCWPDGSLRWLWVRAEVAWGENDQPVHALGVIMDVTARKRAEVRQKTLAELADRLRDLEAPADLAYAAAEVLGRALDVSRVGYGTVDPAAETITIERDWNAPGIESLAGVLHFRDYGSYIEDLKCGETVVFDDAEKDPRTAAHAEALKAISAQAVINMPISERGGLVGLLYLNHESARHWEDDELSLVHEIAERSRAAIARREAEIELRELNRTLERRVDEALAERKLWADVFEASHALIAVVAPGHRLLALNKPFADEVGRLFGQCPRAGDNLLDLVAEFPDQRDAVMAMWDRALMGEAYTLLRPFGPPGAEPSWYEIRFDSIYSREGEFIGAFQFGVNVTERVRAETKLQEAEEALRQSQKMEAIGQLTGGVAHDFNNLLTPIFGSLDLLQRRGVGGEREQRFIEGALQAAERAKTLVQRLLAFARRQPLQPEVIDVNRRTSRSAPVRDVPRRARRSPRRPPGGPRRSQPARDGDPQPGRKRARRDAGRRRPGDRRFGGIRSGGRASGAAGHRRHRQRHGREHARPGHRAVLHYATQPGSQRPRADAGG